MTLDITALLDRFPRARMAHLPTAIEPMVNLGQELGIDLHVKRDDCTGIALGGNKVRQLEFYLGKAQAGGADTVLITGAVQSNFVRTTAAMAARLGMACHIQLEERVPDVSETYRENGNVLLDRLLGATLHSYPEGEDETGADAALADLADKLQSEGKTPYIVPLAGDKPPLGALGYVDAARELVAQGERFDEIVIGSGSALTHIGLLFGLRALGDQTPVRGACVRRDRETQAARVAKRLSDLAGLLDVDLPVSEADILLDDVALAPGYGRMSPAVERALSLAARHEGLILDPVYTAKVLATVIARAEDGTMKGKRVLFWHTGGQPALFGYADRLKDL